MKKAIPLLCVLVLFLGGCSLWQKKIVVFCTDQAEVAAYVEYFNAHQEEIRVELRYSEEPARSVLDESGVPDLILAEGLTSADVLEQLYPVDRFLKREKINGEAFYQDLLASGRYENRQAALPFSFVLPTVVYDPASNGSDIPNLVLSLEYLRNKGAAFNQLVRGSYNRMGFSPLWNSNFLYLGSALMGADFREQKSNNLIWNDEVLAEAVAYFRSWVEETNGGYALEQGFLNRYMYEPYTNLLKERRIRFYLTDSRLLFRALEAREDTVDFRWLAHEGKIYALEKTLYLGMPKKAGNRRGARLFMEWLFDPETQRTLLEINQEKNLKMLGLLGGFSSLREINERDFPRIYPVMIGRIPAEDFLRFPDPLPLDWQRLKAEVLLPWLYEQATEAESGAGLAERLRAFRAESMTP
jgi:hypothetical protein